MRGLSHTYNRQRPRRDESCSRDLGEKEWRGRVVVLLVSRGGLGGVRNTAILVSVSHAFSPAAG